MLPRVRFAIRTGVVLGCGALCLWSVAGENRPAAVDPAASLIRYEVPGGDNYFALALQASSLGAPIAHDHVVLVDTSASQTGDYRSQSLKVVEAFLASLPSADRVKLVAIDIEMKALSEEFVPAGSAEAKAALESLSRRIPLGATNLLPAIEFARDAFTGERARSVVYIGDGMSTGRLIAPEALRGLVENLRNEKVAVHSYAIGPKTDLQLLGLLATHTGGVVLVDEVIDDTKVSADDLGKKLALAADAPIFYADELKVSPQLEKLLPTNVPPLRADRDTVILGKGPVAESLQIVASAKGDARSLKWTVKPAAVQSGNTFLAGLWSVAEQSSGLGISVAGTDMLNIARQEYEQQVLQLVGAGRAAVATRNLNQAEQIAWTIRQLDPANVEADTILTASQKVKAGQIRLARLQTEEAAPGDETPAAPEPGLTDPGTVQDEDLTRLFDEQKKIRTERLTKEVNQTIEAVRKISRDDPDSAISGLKRLLNTVVSSSDIDPIDRENLRKRVQGVLDAVAVQKIKNDQERLIAQQRLAAAQARQLATDSLVQQEERLEQLIDQVRSLLSEGFSGNEVAFEDAEAVARVAWEMAPYAGITACAVFTTEAAGQLDKAQRLRYARADKFLETLGMVEKAHIPFPDEPPVVWPAPEVWKDLTERRKKWASVDLVRYNKNEERIRQTLERPTEVNFIEMTLEDAINYLMEYHSINIWVDKATLADEGVALDQTVTLKLSGVSFRSTLKLLLEPFQLTWVIEDEVMKITTSVKAGERLSTRVYPVADLVIPIITPQAGGIGQGLGGAGGIGQGGGAMGGGQFGAGGGMGGGGMGGMGGGMFNVADEAAPATKPANEFNNSTVRDRKKKLETSL